MKRKFNNLNDTASLKNNSDKIVGIAPYKSARTGVALLPDQSYGFEISSASKGLYYFKQQTDSIEAVDLYVDEGGPGQSWFETVAIPYEEIQQYLRDHEYYNVGEDFYPFFYFTNITKPLDENQHYAVTQAIRDYNIGDILSGSQKDHLYIQEPDKMVLDYDDGYADQVDKIHNLVKYKDDENKEHYIKDITLYIIEDIDEDSCKIVDKGSSKLNATYPLSLHSIEPIRKDEAHIDLIKNGQVVKYCELDGDEFEITTTIYGETYQIQVVYEDNSKTCWGIYDTDRHVYDQVDFNYPKMFKPEEVDSECDVYTTDKEDIRILNKAGIPFFCQSNYKTTEDKVLCGEGLYLEVPESSVTHGVVLFEVYNSHTEETTTYIADYHYKEGEESYYYTEIDHTDDLLQGDDKTIITITCIDTDYKTSTFVHDFNSQVPFVLTDNSGNILDNGATLEEREEYYIKGIDGQQLPGYSTIYINDVLFERLGSPRTEVYLDLLREYISEDNQTVIRIDLETPPTARINISNNAQTTIKLQKRNQIGFYFDVESCPPLYSINVDVESGSENQYRVVSSSQLINAVFDGDSVYHGRSDWGDVTMDVMPEVMSQNYIITSARLGMMSGQFYVNENDNMIFNISTAQKDHITINNSNGTSSVSIAGIYYGSMTYPVATVSAGQSYNLESQTYMGMPVTQFRISQPMGTDSATWLANGSTPISLSWDISRNLINTDETTTWVVPSGTSQGLIGTITLTSSGPTPPTPTTSITVDNTKGGGTILVSGDPNVSYIDGGSSANVSTENNIHLQFKNAFSGTVYYKGNYEGQYYNTEITVNGKGYICNPSSNTDLWANGADGTIIVTDN